MSQYYPPSDDNNGQPQSAPANAQPQQQGNPYFDRVQDNAAPDLDAAAPTLTQTEMQQFNRKAMFFLAAIIGLLLLLAFWIMHSLSNRGEDKKAVTEAQKPTQVVETPDLPRAAPAAPVPDAAAQPIDVVSNAPPLPPMPDRGSARRAGVNDYPVSVGADAQPMANGPHQPSLLERRMWNGNVPPQAPNSDPALAQAQAAAGGMTGMLQGPPGTKMVIGADGNPTWVPQETVRQSESNAKLLANPDALLVRGTYIRCILETRIITDVPGYTSCIVTEPVYSINGRRLLLPRGSKMLGKYDNGGIARGRVAVIWDRITTPNGYDISMASPGTDQLGGAGHPGQYDSHWPSRIASAMLISMISDLFKYEGQKHGPSGTVVTPGGTAYETPYESNTAQTMQNMAQQAINESANRKPTVTINQGTQLNVYVAQDVDFSNVLARR